MTHFAWNAEKDEWLIRVRGISFERVVCAIEDGEILDIVEHHDPNRYPGQRILIVNIDGYAWLVPFVASRREYFLKTIIPSRKATRKYLEQGP
jgi:uncharacterized DUF497 family protein